MKTSMPVFAVIFLVSAMPAAAGTVYKCTDSDGHVTYDYRRHPGNCIVLSPDRGSDEPAVCGAGKCFVRLKKGDGGHFYVSGRVNDAEVRFMIDTGASLVTLPPADARRAGLDYDKVIKFNTAGGNVKGAVASSVPVSISGLPAVRTAVAVNPSLSVPLLGQDFLKHFTVTMQGNTMEIAGKESGKAQVSQPAQPPVMLKSPGRKLGEACTDTSECLGLSRCSDGLCKSL